MIAECKDILRGVVGLAGVSSTKVAFSQKEANDLTQHGHASGGYPYCKILTGTGRFEDSEQVFSQILQNEDGKLLRYYKELRTQRVMPFVVHFFGVDEASCSALVESFIENLPFFWEHKLMQGTVIPIKEEHSDFAGNMNNRYESAVLVEFRVAVGPDAQKGKAIQALEQES